MAAITISSIKKDCMHAMSSFKNKYIFEGLSNSNNYTFKHLEQQWFNSLSCYGILIKVSIIIVFRFTEFFTKRDNEINLKLFLNNYYYYKKYS